MLQVGDELLEINGNTTEGMLHADAITIIKHGGDKVSLIIRRVPETARYSMIISILSLILLSEFC